MHLENAAHIKGKANKQAWYQLTIHTASMHDAK